MLARRGRQRQEAGRGRNPDQERGRLLRDQGVAAYRAGDTQTARSALAQSVELEPTGRTAWLYLARAERNAAELEASLATIERALTHHPGWAAGTWHAADLLLQLGRSAQAAELLRRSEPDEEESNPELLRLGRLALRASAPEAAASLAERVLERNPGDPAAGRLQRRARMVRGGGLEKLRRRLTAGRRVREQGYAAYRAHDWRRAREKLGEATRLNPESRGSWLYLARAERNAGEAELSLATISEALERHPGWAAGTWHAADLELKLGRPEEARHALAAFDPACDDDPDQLLRVGQLALVADATEIARDISEHLIELDPDGPDTIQLAGEVALARGEASRAVAIAENAASDGRTALLAGSIRLMIELGRVKEALELAGRLGSNDERHAVAVARELHRHGFHDAAVAIVDDHTGRGAARLRELAGAELRVLKGGWRPTPPAANSTRRRRRRILHVTGSSLPHRQSGYTVRTHRTVTAQRAAGFDPHVITQPGFGAPDGGRAVELIDDIPHHRMPMELTPAPPIDHWIQRGVDLAAEAVAEIRPAVLHPASDYRNALVALAVGKASGTPVVYEVRGFWEESWLSRQPDPETAERSDLYSGRRETELECMQEADHIVTLGKAMKQAMVARGVPAEQITVIPNGVDTDHFAPRPRDDRLALEHGIGADDVVVGAVSSLVGYEGFADLITALTYLGASAPVRCLIVGEGPERPRLASLAESLGVADRVILPGAVRYAEIPAYYSLIDVFALPRRADRVCDLVTPLKPFEAMASGCAVVVSDRAALREVVEEEVTGLVAPAEDPIGLAAVIDTLLDDPRLRAELAASGSEWVRRERTWRGNATRYREIYEELGAAVATA